MEIVHRAVPERCATWRARVNVRTLNTDVITRLAWTVFRRILSSCFQSSSPLL